MACATVSSSDCVAMDPHYDAANGESYSIGETQPETQATQPFSQTQRLTQPHATARPSTLPPTFGLLVPRTAGRPFALERHQDEYIIGRNSKGKHACDFIIDDKKVSGHHARIIRESEGNVVLIDMSTNGTFLNERRMGKGVRILLNRGDEICFGPPSGEMDDQVYVWVPTSAGWSVGELEQKAGGLYKSYDMREAIGKGSFATVKKAVRKSDGRPVAVKIINKKRFQANEKTMDMLRREVDIYKALDHPFIAKFEDYFEDDTYMYTVLEYVDGGDLLEYVTNRGGLPEADAQEVSRQVCSAVAYLHSQGIAHRDLKPDNLLLTDDEQPKCKVTDFGLAKLANEATFLKTMCGTPSYLAPEVILQEQHSGYDFACDAWSIGVLVYAALANALPFEEDEKEDLRERMKKRFPDMLLLHNLGISDVGQDFVERLMIYDPKLRMTAAQALEHPWLRAAVERAESSGEIGVSVLPSAVTGRTSPTRARDPAIRNSMSTEPGTDLRTPSEHSQDSSYARKMGHLHLTSPVEDLLTGSIPFAANAQGWYSDDDATSTTAAPSVVASKKRGVGSGTGSSQDLLPPKKKTHTQL